MSGAERDGEIIRDPVRQRKARITDLQGHKAAWMSGLIQARIEQLLGGEDDGMIGRATGEIKHIDSISARLRQDQIDAETSSA